MVDDEITADNDTVTKEWTFTLTFVNLDYDQALNSDKVFSSEIILQQGSVESEGEEEVITLASMILEDNGGIEAIELKGDPDFSVNPLDDDMFATEDNYGTSYYFRGYNENYKTSVNNYLSFAGKHWVIVRINGDGSIRIALNPNVSVSVQSQIETVFNSSNDSFEYAGYMYTLGEQHGLDNDSAIKTVLDKWYEDNLKDEYANYLSDTTFCYSRIVYTDISGENLGSGIGTTDFYSKSYVNLLENNPSLLCDVKADYYTVDDTENGNGALTYPIALITADELVYAGERAESGYVKSYFYNSFNGTYSWVGTPSFNWYGITVGFASHLEFYGLTGFYTDFNDYGIMGPGVVSPVINLKADTVASGTGTESDPYVVG